MRCSSSLGVQSDANLFRCVPCIPGLSFVPSLKEVCNLSLELAAEYESAIYYVDIQKVLRLTDPGEILIASAEPEALMW